jgi:hypothetical protein
MLFHPWRGGTRFRLYPKAHEGFLDPETVILSPPAGTIGPGPADRRMHVVDALDKEGPYDPPRWVPPYRGRAGPPAVPGRDGHFDCIAVSDPSFLSAHLYGCVRRVIDIWEALLGREIVWWHHASYPSTELIPSVRWDNAQSGAGFIETGARRNDRGEMQIFCLNFEIVGHEVGHAIIFSSIGVPAAGRLTAEYLAFQESFADLISLVSVMFFASVVAKLLAQTHGNLYVLNMLNRIGELSETQQIRIADNETTMSDLDGLAIDQSGQWIDPSGAGRNAHDLAQPLTGAIFDILVEIFQDRLAQRGILRPEADARGWVRGELQAAMAQFERHWGGLFARFEPQFRAALLYARDIVGRCLAMTLERLPADDLSYSRVAGLFLSAAAALGEGHHLEALRQHFLARAIVPESMQDMPPPVVARPAMPLAMPRAPCFAQRVTARRRALELAVRRRRAEDRTSPVIRLLRHAHRLPDHPR